MIKLKYTHWCHNCFVSFKAWELRGTDGNLRFIPGAALPHNVELPETVKSECPHCKHKMVGEVVVIEQEGAPRIFAGVKEIS